MTVFRPPVYDESDEIVTLRDVGPIDPAPPHAHVERVEGCWACVIHRARYGCVVRPEGGPACGDVVAEGSVCEKHRKRRAA